MKKKLVACLLAGMTLMTVLSGCNKKEGVDEVRFSSEETVSETGSEEITPLMAYPEHTIQEIMVQKGSVTKDVVVEEEPGNDTVEKEEYPFLYFGNKELGYGLLCDGFEKVDDTTYIYKTDNDGSITFTIDGYEKGGHDFTEWVTFIKENYSGEMNFQTEIEDANYVCFSFNPNNDMNAVTLLEITDMGDADSEREIENANKGYIHICLITAKNCDPEATTGEFYPYGHFDYEPFSFLEELGDVKLEK